MDFHGKKQDFFVKRLNDLSRFFAISVDHQDLNPELLNSNTPLSVLHVVNIIGRARTGAESGWRQPDFLFEDPP